MRSATQPAPSPRSTDAAGEATNYAREVIAGKIVACKWVILACKRHIRDLERQSDEKFDFRFDEAKANRACRLIELLPHTKGRWAAAKETIQLQPWQRFIVCSLFGWVQKETGLYRFTDAYICVPRKNGKSILGAAIGHFKFAADGEFGAEVYSGATSEKQAWEVFRPAKQMAERTPDLRTSFGIEVNAKSLTIPCNGSRFEPVIGKPGDGASPSCAIIDEYHEHLSNDLVDTMRTGMAARENPLLFKITTAGSDRSSPCYANQGEGQRVLEGKIHNERFFCIIYTIDDGDDWKSKLALQKANPNLNVSVSSEFLAGEQRNAIQSARLQNTYKTKYLNIWVTTAVSWMNMAKWDAAADPTLSLEQFKGDECRIGVDLAERVDIACKVRLFRRMIEGKNHYYAFATHYINEFAVQEAKNQHYVGWSSDGRLQVTSGNATDYIQFAAGLSEDSGQFIVREIAYDPYHVGAMRQFIEAQPEWNRSILWVDISQSYQNMSAAMKEVEAVVLDGRFHHDGDPVLAWMMSNVVCKRDWKDNIFPAKERPENKIDGAVALIMAMKRTMDTQNQGASVYEERGILTL